jgi:HAE1 family hydrophobic/amphiphilic exporter-1
MAITGRTLQVSVQSNRPLEELAPLADQFRTKLQPISGLVDIATNYTPGKPELRLLADPARIGDLGLTNQTSPHQCGH